MSRTRASARKAGSWMETETVKYLRRMLGDDRIERRVKNGAKDRGDITGVRTVDGKRVVVEVKNTSRVTVGSWLGEAEVERGNDAADVGVVVAKRVGVGEARMGEQLVLMTLDDLIVLLGGDRA